MRLPSACATSVPFCARCQFSRGFLSGEKNDYIWKFLGGFFVSKVLKRHVKYQKTWLCQRNPARWTYPARKRQRNPDVNMATVLQGLQMTLAQLAKNSELKTEAIQNLKEDILLCSGDEGTEDTPAMDDHTSDNTLDIAATINNVLNSSDNSKTTSVKSPESGSQSALVDSLTQAFTTSKVTSSATDLFSLYILFSQFRPRDVTLENCFFQISSHSRAHVRIICAKTKGPIPMCTSRGIYWGNKTYMVKRSIAKTLTHFYSPLGSLPSPSTDWMAPSQAPRQRGGKWRASTGE